MTKTAYTIAFPVDTKLLISESGKYKKLTSSKQEEHYLRNHPLEKPVRIQKLKSEESISKLRPITWYSEVEEKQDLFEDEVFAKRNSEDFSVSKTNLKKNKLTASEPLLSTFTGQIGTPKKEKNSSTPTKLFSFGFVKLREKVSKRSVSSTSKQQSKPDKSKNSNQSRPISTPHFLSTMRQRNSDSGSSLLDTLENKRFRTAFLDFLQSEYSSENLCFWLSCEKFRKLKNVDQRFKEGQDIYSQYISTNSPLQINIDHLTRRQITIAMTCGEDVVPCDVFDRAQGKVFSIMENDSFPRFVNSNFYKEASSAKKNTFESVFSTILSGSISPTKPWSKNANNNNMKDNHHLSPSKEDSSDKSTVFQRFSFGFKKLSNNKTSKDEVLTPDSDYDESHFYGVEVKVA